MQQASKDDLGWSAKLLEKNFCSRKQSGGEMMLDEIKILVSKTANGKADYIQVLSADQFSLNLTAVAAKVTIEDKR